MSKTTSKMGKNRGNYRTMKIPNMLSAALFFVVVMIIEGVWLSNEDDQKET